MGVNEHVDAHTLLAADRGETVKTCSELCPRGRIVKVVLIEVVHVDPGRGSNVSLTDVKRGHTTRSKNEDESRNR